MEASKTEETNLPLTEVGAASEVETGEDVVVDTTTTRCVVASLCAVAEVNTTKLKV
jgi:hypothetical protein